MSNLTIDQILAEARGESPDVYSLEKEASAQPPKSSQFSEDEIEKMASLLKEAKLPEGQPESFNEKVAAALILSDTIHSLAKEAEAESSESEEGEKKKDEKKEDSSKEKLAHFVEKAAAAGCSEEEIQSFLEKKAKSSGLLKNIGKVLKSKPAKATAGLGALGGAGYAGSEVGEYKEREKAKKVMPKIFRAGAQRGYQAGARKGFQAGAYASDNAWRKLLKKRMKKEK